MDLFLQIKISGIQARYSEGTAVVLFGVNGVPDETVGTVEFVDDLGFIFIETPEVYRNVVLSPADEEIRFLKK